MSDVTILPISRWPRVRQVILPTILATGLLAVSGCAKSPSTLPASSGTQLIITMTVAGHINPGYTYFVLFNPVAQANQTTGPIPVVGIPWGNGFATGAFTAFLRYDPSQPNSGYGMYQVVPGTNLLSFAPLAAPTQFTPVSNEPNQNQLQFQIPLSAIPTGGVTATNLQINFLATDRIVTNPNDPGTKHIDALGDTRLSSQINSFITVPTATSGLFNNSTALEPSGDVMLVGSGVSTSDEIQDLDITDWSVEVRSGS